MSCGWRILIGLIGVALIGLFLAWFAHLASAPPAAPSFNLADRTGRMTRLADYRGQIVVINFWASWCPPCRAEMPMLSRAAHRLRDKGVAFVGIAVDEPAAVADYLARYPVSYPILNGPDTGQLQRLYTAAYHPKDILPYTVIVGRNGRIVSQMAGRLSRQRLREALAPLIAR